MRLPEPMPASPKNTEEKNVLAQPGAVEGSVIPVIAEFATVGKRTVTKARVKVSKKVTEREEGINLQLTEEAITVHHVPRNLIVSEAPQVRQEGNVTIIPVLKEIVVVEKKLMLVEEVHITRRATDHHHLETITLRQEELTVTRIATDNDNPVIK